jgi:hypothetical protein
MTTRRLLALLAVAVVATASPAFAVPNNGAFAKSSAALRAQQQQLRCGIIRDKLDIAESNADERSGTKAAEPYSKEADDLWASGVANGCAWAR